MIPPFIQYQSKEQPQQNKEKIYHDIALQKLEYEEHYDEPLDYFETIELHNQKSTTVTVLILKEYVEKDYKRNYQIWLIDIDEKDKEAIEKEEEENKRWGLYKNIHVLLRKKEVTLPIIINEHSNYNYHTLTITDKDNCTRTYPYHQGQHQYIQEKTSQEQKLIKLLHKHILFPINNDYFSGEEQEERINHTETALMEKCKNNPKQLLWLLKLEDYEYPDEYGLYIEIRVLCLNLIHELEESAELLYSIAQDYNIEVYLRYRAIDYLNKRKDREHLKKLIPLLNMERYEVLSSLLNAYAQNQIIEALPNIKKIKKKRVSFPISDLLTTRAKLGDKGVLKALIAQQHNPWHKESLQQALKSLTEQMGIKETLDALYTNYKTESIEERYKELYENSTIKNIRYWSIIKQKELTSEGYMNILNDEDWYIQNYVADQLIQTSELIEECLKERILHAQSNNVAKHWMIYILLIRGEEVHPLLDTIEDIRITLPSFVTKELREYIVQTWYKYAQDKTDIRWIIEGLLLEKNAPKISIENTEEKKERIQKKEIWKSGSYRIFSQKEEVRNPKLERLKKSIKQQGLTISNCESQEDAMGSGSSSYYIITIPSTQKIDSEEDDVYLDRLYTNKIANFATYIERYIHIYEDDSDEERDEKLAIVVENKRATKGYKNLLEQTGYIYLTEEQNFFIFPKLNIYYFGDRKPLSIHRLVFYWQD